MRLRLHTALAVALGALACSTPDDSSGDLHLVLVQAPESATPGADSALAVLVKVVNGDGTAVTGVPVNWSIASGGGTIRATADTSGVDGLAAAQWTAGLAAGSQQVAASIYGDEALKITISTPALHADKVDAGYGAMCALQGTVTWCWVKGRNSNQTVRVLSQVQAKELALGDDYLCVVDTGGVTYCRRTGRFSQAAPPDDYESVAGLPPLSAISSGDNYFCGIAVADLTPWCWRGNLVANQVSPTLRLTSITASTTGFGCGLAEDGAAWCWNGDAPSPVPGGHVFRQISAGAINVCALEAPTRLYCWGVGQAPVPMTGASPVGISMGFSRNLMSVQSGVMSFRVDPATAELTIYNAATFPYPALQISGDDNSCLIAYDGSVYCLGMNESFEQLYFADWAGIPAPLP